METVMNIVVDYRIIEIGIGLMALFALAIILERTRAYYIEFSISSKKFLSKIINLVKEDKLDEAIQHCSSNEKKPLAFVLKCVLEKSDRDEKTMDASLDIAASEVGPKISKNLPYLAMVANVATLIGLLGTVLGIIMSFRAVSFADPAQKQALLADGISLAMYSTALGLLIAIPTLIILSFLTAKQNKLFTDIDECSLKLLDVLKNRDFAIFKGRGIYPSGLGLDPSQRGPIGIKKVNEV